MKRFALLTALLFLAACSEGTPPRDQTRIARAQMEEIAAIQISSPFVTQNSDWTPVTQAFEDVIMVLVPAGCFNMGNDSDAYDWTAFEAGVMSGGEQCFDEAFWIDQTEVTQADFERLNGTAYNPSYFPGDERPVERITWSEARDFCAGRAARLPTEAEWEYAARGPSEWNYPWGNEWVSTNAVWNTSQTANVGSIPSGASWVGAFDMIGNVWEWTSSLLAPYPYNTSHENDQDTTTERVVRGGSWEGFPDDLPMRAAVRSWNLLNGRERYFGFRCARAFN